MSKAISNYQPKSKEIDVAELKKSKKTKLKRYKDAVYFGEMFNDKRHGKGLLILRTGGFFEGNFENDLKHGKGYEITHNGCKYEG